MSLVIRSYHQVLMINQDKYSVLFRVSSGQFSLTTPRETFQRVVKLITTLLMVWFLIFKIDMWIYSAFLGGTLFNVLLLAFKEYKQLASKYLRRFLTCIPNHKENYSVLEDPDFETLRLETLPQENTRKKKSTLRRIFCFQPILRLLSILFLSILRFSCCLIKWYLFITDRILMLKNIFFSGDVL